MEAGSLAQYKLPISSVQLPNLEEIMKKLEKLKLTAHKTVQISGSKSISNRLLILESLFKNIKISNLSNSQDTQLLKKALSENTETVDIHHAGTAMRFLTSYYSILKGKRRY